MAVKKTTSTATKKVAEKKVTAAKPSANKAAEKKVVYVNAENAGFRAGDVYQTLAAAGKALSATEISKVAKISVEDVYLGIGWLFKEGKIKEENNLVTLA